MLRPAAKLLPGGASSGSGFAALAPPQRAEVRRFAGSELVA